MRCHEEQFVEDAVFHIYNRSMDEISLFRNDADYLYFIEKLQKLVKDNEIYAYCLMPNHFHLCIQQLADRPIYKIMNGILTSYAMHYNRKYQRRGKLFAGKLQHKLITKDNYVLQLCKYIHNNPVKAGLVDDINRWKYSNYHEYVGSKESQLYSTRLIEIFPCEFENYANTMKQYKDNFEEIKLYVID